jgi:hypothetical protein
VIHESVFTSVGWPLLLCLWVLAIDMFALVESTSIPSPITVVDEYLKAIKSGELCESLLTTGIRITTTLTLSILAAIGIVFIFGEFPNLRVACGRWLRFAALIPPFVLMFYRTTLDTLFRFGATPWRIDGRYPSWTDPFVLALGSPARVLWLTLAGFWPLVIIGLDRYLRISAMVRDETLALKVPWWRCCLLKLPSVLHAMQPGFLLSIAFIVLSCKEIEVDGARASPKQGFFYYFFDEPYSHGDFGRFFVGVTGSVLIGLVLLHLWEWIVLILAGSDD